MVGRADEAESQLRNQPQDQSQVPQQAPAPAVPDMGGFFQAFQTYLQRPPPPPPASQSYLDRFLKLAPSPFKGERNPDIGEAWLNELEKKFRVMKCPEEEKTELAVYMLQGPAEIWWGSLLRSTFAKHEEITWDMFLEAFQEKYFPMHIREAKESEFLQLEQGQRTVADYEAKFSELGRYAPHVCSNERWRIRKFVDGLKGPIRRHVAVHDPSTFSVALRLAHLAERENNRYCKLSKFVNF